MTKIGITNRPYPRPPHKPDLAYAIQKRRDDIHIADLPSAHAQSKLAHVYAWEDLGWDYVWLNPDGSFFQQGSTNKNRRLTLSAVNGFNGVTNPHWKDQVRNGQNATTSASGVITDFSQPFISAEVIANDPIRGKFTSNWYGHVPLFMPSGSNPSASQITFANNRAIGKFLDHLDAIDSSVEALQDFGEWKQTLHGVTAPLQSLKNHIGGYFDKLGKLKRSFKNTPSVAFHRAVTDTYLEFHFGWIPLAEDVRDGLLGMQDTRRDYDVYPVKGSFKLDYDGSNTTTFHNGVDNAALLAQSHTTKNSNSYIVCYKGAMRSGFAGKDVSLNAVLQLDLPHFIPSVWDLIPYSFVVDYFLNVGNVIRSYSLNTSTLAWVSKTTILIRRADTRTWIESAQNPGWKNVVVKDDSVNSWVETRTFTRDPVDASALHPKLQISLPTSDTVWTNIGALIGSRVKSLVPLKFL